MAAIQRDLENRRIVAHLNLLEKGQAPGAQDIEYAMALRHQLDVRMTRKVERALKVA
jgi:hypothetical protein